MIHSLTAGVITSPGAVWFSASLHPCMRTYGSLFIPSLHKVEAHVKNMKTPDKTIIREVHRTEEQPERVKNQSALRNLLNKELKNSILMNISTFFVSFLIFIIVAAQLCVAVWSKCRRSFQSTLQTAEWDLVKSAPSHNLT